MNSVIAGQSDRACSVSPLRYFTVLYGFTHLFMQYHEHAVQLTCMAAPNWLKRAKMNTANICNIFGTR